MKNQINGRYPIIHLKSWLFFILFLLLTLILSTSQLNAASTIIVNSTLDEKRNDGLCTLREAFIAANGDRRSGSRSGECIAGSGDDTIILPAGTYLLTRTDSGTENAAQTGDLDIKSNLVIIGDGAAVTIIDGSSITDRIIHAFTNNVTISGVTLRQGHATGNGGGLLNQGSNLTLIDVAVMENQATGAGGGIANSGGSLTAVSLTVANNNANGYGGGLYLNNGSVSLTNSTISGNNGSGSGKDLHSRTNTLLSFVTVGGDTAVAARTLSLNNTILAGNCTGTLISQGHNLIQSTNCTITGNTTGNIVGQDPLLEPLADNGGGTLTHALQATSPAVNAANTANCPATDQRGISRPQNSVCDIGAFELENLNQTGPILIVNTAEDTDDGACSFVHCTLREALNWANISAISNAIHFNIPGSNPPTIFLQSALPVITDPVTIDGTTQPGGWVVLDGSQAGTAVGLHITAGDSTVRGLHIVNFSSQGILIATNGGNLIEGNEIAHNGGDGIRINQGSGNQLSNNNIHDNDGLSIDLDGDGRTANDPDDPDSGANIHQNFPNLINATPEGAGLHVLGRLDSVADTTYTLEFFAGTTCHIYGGSQSFLGTAQVTTNEMGNVYFNVMGLTAVPLGHFINATATDPYGNTSELSDCLSVSPGNTAWVTAMPVEVVADMGPTAVDQYLDQPGQSRWFKFTVQPGSKVIVTLTNLPANYDLTIYKDIAQAFNDLSTPQDLPHLDAEFAPEAFSPEAFSPEAFSPEAFSPEAFSPEAFSPEAFSPEAFSPEAFSPEAFSPEAFSPEAFSPDAFSPEAFSPEAFSPEAFSPEAFSPEAFSPEAFSGAQLRSLLGVSAFRGIANEGLIINTWNNSGDFYVRVRGANGAFNNQFPFRVSIEIQSGNCGDVMPITNGSTTTPTAGNYQTIILTDLARMAGTAAEKATLSTQLAAFAARPEVAGVIVDLGADARVTAANIQADAYPACPYAKNLVADTIKEIVDGHWALNPLQYVVIVGNDATVPFYRYPDLALLANENNYVPPVRDNTASQASLRLGFVLGQDAYGARTEVSFKSSTIPIPELAVGRLVETAVDTTTQLNAYLATPDGITTLSTPPLVTGYDFLEDAALAVQTELEAGTGQTADTLIADRNLAPADPASWTADDLRAVLLGSRHDLTFLAGHFSASGALAADYTTRMTAEELITSPVNLQNAIIFSAGCHAGYNIVDADGVPLVTEEPDWAQAFAQKGALLIAGTGYQYGDTDFIEYSERLYLNFSQALRTGSGPVSVGQALVAAKQQYLAETPQMRGIHEKALIEATLFGLPHLSVDMPGVRLSPDAEPSAVGSTTPVSEGPGSDLGLTTADLSLTPALTGYMVDMDNMQDETAVTAFYLSGPDGVLTNPAEPTLPLERVNVGVSGSFLRGVGFRGGSYTDLSNILPFTGAPTTEIRGVHAPFQADIFYPVQFWRANYFDQLANPTNGNPFLAVTPAQFMSDEPGAQTGTMRRFDGLDFRLFYSNNIATYNDISTPALAAPATIAQVTATPDDDHIDFAVDVVSNPAAGVQEVWVVYTAVNGAYFGQWQSLDLSQDTAVSTRWQGTLPLLGTDPSAMRYLVQAVNGVGLVSLAANLGDLYVPGTPPAATNPTEVVLIEPPTTGAYGTQMVVQARLTSSEMPLAGQRITFGLGPQSRQGITDEDGRATVTLTLLGLPGEYDLQASYAGAGAFAASFDTADFTITKQDTVLTLTQPAVGYADDDVLLTATLTAVDGHYLGEETVIFVITGENGAASIPVITDFAGRARLGNVPLPPGEYTVNAYFSGAILLHTGEILTLDNARYNPATASGTLTLLEPNSPPDCDTAVTDPLTVWPLTGHFVLVYLTVTDPDDDPVSLTVTGIFQDEPVGGFPYTPDGGILSDGTPKVRAERDVYGNGRVYHIFFTATDNVSGSCSGVVRIPVVPPDWNGDIDAIDEGPLYDSTIPQ